MTKSIEIVIKKPTENQFLQAIEFNFDELRLAIEEAVKPYKGITFTEDTVKQAKDTRAYLNKAEGALEAKRKEVKAALEKPYKDFASKVEELTAPIKAASDDIDAQIKTFENKQRMEKRAELSTYFTESVGPLKEIVSFEDIFSEKWLNSTVSPKKAKEEIFAALHRIASDLRIIDGLKTEFETEVKSLYLRTKDISQALEENTRLTEQKTKMDAYKASQQKTPEAEVSSPAPVTTPAKIAEPIKEIVRPVAEPISTEPKISMKLKFTGTAQQLQKLKRFLLENNIQHESI